MFGMSITSKYIKYIGLFLVLLVLVVTFIGLYNSINDYIHDTFGIKTKEQKLVELKVKNSIQENNIIEIQKEVKVDRNITDIKVKNIIDYKDTIAIHKDTIDKIIHKTKIKPKVEYIVKDNNVLKNIIINDTSDANVSYSINKKEYIKYGTENIDSIYAVFDYINGEVK